MPNSLKCRLKKLKHQGLLSEKDLSRIYTDNDVIAELEKIKQEIQSIIALADSREEDTKLAYQCQTVINERISELKGEINENSYQCFNNRCRHPIHIIENGGIKHGT